jgi:hypothetical protein
MFGINESKIFHQKFPDCNGSLLKTLAKGMMGAISKHIN